MRNNTSIIGVLLSGGKSTRMGRDKGLIPFLNKTWASLGADKLEGLGLPVVYSIHAGQEADYARVVGATPEEATLVTDDESIPVRGPLLGLLSIHRCYPEADLFLLACDLPYMEKEVLAALLEQYRKEPGHEVYLYGSMEEPEPVCAIYTSKALKGVTLEEGMNNALRYWLKKWDTMWMPIPEKQTHCFRNLNSPDEWGG